MYRTTLLIALDVLDPTEEISLWHAMRGHGVNWVTYVSCGVKFYHKNQLHPNSLFAQISGSCQKREGIFPTSEGAWRFVKVSPGDYHYFLGLLTEFQGLYFNTYIDRWYKSKKSCEKIWYRHHTPQILTNMYYLYYRSNVTSDVHVIWSGHCQRIKSRWKLYQSFDISRTSFR